MKHLSTTLMILAVQCISSADVMCSEHHSRHRNRSSHTHGVSQIQERALERHLSDEQESLTEGQESLQGKQGQLTTNRSKHKQQNKDIGMSSSSRMRSRHHKKQVMTITDEELEKVTRSSKHSDKDKIEHAPRRPTSNKNRQSGQHNKLVITNVPVQGNRDFSSSYMSSGMHQERVINKLYNMLYVNVFYLSRACLVYLEKAGGFDDLIRDVKSKMNAVMALQYESGDGYKGAEVLTQGDILGVVPKIHGIHEKYLQQKEVSQDLIYAYNNMVQDELRVINKFLLSYKTFSPNEEHGDGQQRGDREYVQDELQGCINSIFGIDKSSKSKVELKTACDTLILILNKIKQYTVEYYKKLCHLTDFGNIAVKMYANGKTLSGAVSEIMSMSTTHSMQEESVHFISRMYYTMLDIGYQILASNKNKESSDQKNKSVDQNKNVRCVIISLPYIVRAAGLKSKNNDYYGKYYVTLSLLKSDYDWNNIIACTEEFIYICKLKINEVVDDCAEGDAAQLVKFMVKEPFYGPLYEYKMRLV